MISVQQNAPNPPTFYTEGLRGWVAVTSPSTGQYCLTPDASSTLENSALVLSMGAPGGGTTGFVIWEGYCSQIPVTFAVATEDINGHPVNNAPFTAVIP